LSIKKFSLEKFFEIFRTQGVNNTHQFDYATALSAASLTSYNATEIIPSVFQNYARFSSGLLKLLTNIEVIDVYMGSTYVPERYDSRQRTFAFMNGQIINNFLLKNQGSGCFFPSLGFTRFFIQNIAISFNNITDELQTPFPGNNSQLSDVTGNYRFGLFCAYSQDSYSTVSGTSIVAQNLSMNANNAVLFNLYPENQAYSYIFDSIFKNNKCYTSSIIIASGTSQVVSIGNTFFNNYNRLGNIYILNNGSYQGVFNSFLSNNGAHASILFGNNVSSEASEGGSILYNNSAKPATLIASDLMTPQGGLYFLDTCVMSIIGSDFNANSGGYSGAIVSIESTVKLSNSTFENTWVTGVALIGVFTPLSSVTLQDIQYINNTVTADQTLAITQKAAIDLFNSKFNIQGFNVTDGAVGGGSSLISLINSQGSIANMSIEQFYTSDGITTAASIITAVFSKINLTEISCDDTISLVKAYQATIRIDTITIKNLQEESGYRFMIDLTDSSLWTNQMKYVGSILSAAALPLIGGENNEIQIINSEFLNAFNQQNKLFGLSNNGLFYISDCVFEYTQDPGKMMLFGISYSKQVIIQNSVFRNVSSVVQVSNIQNIFTFLNNVVVANSKMGILSVQESPLVYIQNNIFLGVSEIDTGDMIAGSQLEIINPEGTTVLQGNTFSNLASKNGIVGVSSQSDADAPYDVTLSCNVFVNNKGSNGGAIYLYAEGSGSGKPVATIQDSVFLLNQAKTVKQNKGRGGVIYQTTPDETTQSTILKRNLYISNRADAIGGAIFYDYSPVNFDLNSQYFNNTAAASRPNNIGSYPIRFILFNPDKPTNITYEPGDTIPTTSSQADLVTLTGVGSGVPNKQEYIFALLDQYNQVVFDDSSSNLEVQEGLINSLRLLASGAPFYEGPEIVADDGLYYLKDFILNYDIDKNVNMTLTSSAVPDFLTAPISAASFQKSLTVQVSFRDCGIGEYILKEGDYYTCHECPVGFWQLSSNPPASTCDPCNPISTLCLGGFNIGPTPGYWRMNEYADQVLKCPIEGACLGNPINYTPDTILNPTGACANHYEGNLCATCVGDYGHDDNGKCIDCGANFGYLIKFILTLIVTLLIIAFAVKWTSMFGQKFTENQLTGPKKAILIRIALHYMQVVVLIASILAPWPAFLQQAFWIYGRISAINQQFSYLDCIIQLIADKFDVRVVFLNAAITIVSPVVFIIIAIIFWVLYFLIKKRRLRRNRDFWQKIDTTSLILYFTMFQPTLNAVFPLLNCKNIYRKDTPLYYMVSDYEVRCWTGYHWTWLIILAILTFFIWGIVFAYLAFRILRTIKRKMKENKMAKKFAWVYMGYKTERYYWEFVVLQRKVLLVCAVVFGSFHSTGLQICLFLVVMLASFSAQIIVRPYKSALFNTLEDVGCASICVLMFCVIYFQLIQDIPTLKIVVGAVGLAATLWFLGFIGVVAFRLRRMKPGEEEEELNETASLKLSVNRSDPSAPINMSEIPFGRQPSILSFHQRKESSVGFISNSDPHLEEEEPARHRRSIPEIPGSLVVISSEEEEKENEQHEIHTSPKERRIPKSADGRQDENFMLDPDDVVLQDRNKPHANPPLSVQLPRRKMINPFRDHMGEPTYPDEADDDNSKYFDPLRRSDSKFEPPRQIFRKVANPFQDPDDDSKSEAFRRSDSNFEPPRQIFRKVANPFQDHLGEPTHPDELEESKCEPPNKTGDEGINSDDYKSQRRTDTLSSEPALEGEAHAKKNIRSNSEESNFQSSGRAGKPPRRKTRASRHYLYNKDDSRYVTEGNEMPFKTVNNESWQSLTLSENAQDFNGRGSFKNDHIISEPGFNFKDDIIEEKEKEGLEDDADEIENLNGEKNVAE